MKNSLRYTQTGAAEGCFLSKESRIKDKRMRSKNVAFWRFLRLYI